MAAALLCPPTTSALAATRSEFMRKVDVRGPCRFATNKGSSPRKNWYLKSTTGRLVCKAQIGLFFSSVTGHTEEAADILKDIMPGEMSKGEDISDVESSSLTEFDALIVGAPTWHTGADTERSGTGWDDKLDEIAGLDLSGKTVAVFGLGDSAAYGDNFCDAIEEIHDTFQKAGAKMVGYVSTEGYDYSESKSVRDDKFIGLPLDADNESDLTEERIKNWCTQLVNEGMQ